MARLLTALLAGLTLSPLCAAQIGFDLEQPSGIEPPVEIFDSRLVVDVTVAPGKTRVAPGERLLVKVVFDHHEGYHVHTNDPDVPPALGTADDYYATVIHVELPDGVPIDVWTDAIHWPEVHKIEVGWMGEPVIYGVFAGRAVALIPMRIADDALDGPVTFRVKPGFQACDDLVCRTPTPYPPRPGDTPTQDWLEYGYDVTLQITAAGGGVSATATASDFEGFDEAIWDVLEKGYAIAELDVFGWEIRLNAARTGGFLLLLLLAALGGFLLNLTPCVLPVIPIKVMSIAGTASGDRGKTLLLGVVMSLGVIAFWVALGGAIAFVSVFTSSNQLFQYPAFTITVGAIIAILAVGMCGVFSLQLPRAVYQYSPSLESMPGSFAFGVMTAVLSTPCTAPFMGAAMAWAATQTPAIVLTTFVAIGVGMAFPYLLLSAFPQLLDRVPRTGPASELIKQIMGLLMLAAAAFFVGTGMSGLLVRPPLPPTLVYWWLVAACGAMGGGWMAYRGVRIGRSPTARLCLGVIGVAILAGSAMLGRYMTYKGPIDWVYYTPERFEQAKSAGDVVVMDFTAEWCLNCKLMERSVLWRPDVHEVLNGPGITPIKVDLTGNNEMGNALLAELEWAGIPLLVIFGPDGTPVFKQAWYTRPLVLDGIEAARKASVVATRRPG